ncbi:hypothetical protein KY389_11605 [Paracoccus bogoriensis]|nr:hypothetical protein [Paracoccus bogoriensis]
MSEGFAQGLCGGDGRSDDGGQDGRAGPIGKGCQARVMSCRDRCRPEDRLPQSCLHSAISSISIVPATAPRAEMERQMMAVSAKPEAVLPDRHAAR